MSHYMSPVVVRTYGSFVRLNPVLLIHEHLKASLLVFMTIGYVGFVCWATEL